MFTENRHKLHTFAIEYPLKSSIFHQRNVTFFRSALTTSRWDSFSVITRRIWHRHKFKVLAPISIIAQLLNVFFTWKWTAQIKRFIQQLSTQRIQQFNWTVYSGESRSLVSSTLITYDSPTVFSCRYQFAIIEINARWMEQQNEIDNNTSTSIR